MQIRMLREIDALFEGTPQTRKTLEAKEEMLQNLMEKYNDLLAEGRSEEAAFNIALSSVGDISDLMEELRQPGPKAASFPEPDLPDYAETPPYTPMNDQGYARHRQAMIVSTAVMLYILSPIAIIFYGGRFGLLLLFVMAAAATGLLVYNGIARPGQSPSNQEDDSAHMAANLDAASQLFDLEPEARRKTNKKQKRLFASLTSALWMMTVALYFVISFSTHAWHITWIIFLIAGAANSVIRAVIDLYRR